MVYVKLLIFNWQLVANGFNTLLIKEDRLG